MILSAALARQRIAIQIPSDIGAVEQKDAGLAREWREATRWAFTEALHAGFFVAEFCRTVRGQQGPGNYLLEKGNSPSMSRSCRENRKPPLSSVVSRSRNPILLYDGVCGLCNRLVQFTL